MTSEIHWLAIDDGSSKVRALRVSPETCARVVVGADVTVTVSPRLRYVYGLTVQRLPAPVNRVSPDAPALPVRSERAAAALGTPVELADLAYAGPDHALDGVRALQYVPLAPLAERLLAATVHVGAP